MKSCMCCKQRETDAPACSRCMDAGCGDDDVGTPCRLTFPPIVALAAILDHCADWMRRHPPLNSWGCLDRDADRECDELIKRAREAVQKWGS